MDDNGGGSDGHIMEHDMVVMIYGGIVRLMMDDDGGSDGHNHA